MAKITIFENYANGLDIRSVMSLSSKSEGSTAAVRPRTRNAPLHDRVSVDDIVKIKEAFETAANNKLLPKQFRELLRTLLNVEYDDDEYNLLFLKINSNRNGEIAWEELVSHLLLGYFGEDAEKQREALQPAIMGLPIVMRSQHKYPISKICFCPDVDKQRRPDPMQGSYITASSDGMIKWWTLDMKLLRTAYSSSPHLKVHTTWVTDMVCMPDMNIIVTSSTERDLRFYDCTAKAFTLKIVLTSWEYMICTMYYYFSSEESERCLLICGDVGGNVRVLHFSPEDRGPFQNRADRPLVQLRHVDLQKRPHLLPKMRLVEFPKVHSEWVRQVSYYAKLHCVVSCATCSDSLLMADLAGSKTHNMFRIDKGIQCFAFEESAHVLVTGGPDCCVRVWNPFVPVKPSVVLVGHHAGIISIVLQNAGARVYSLSRDRVIKVWDVHAAACVQTYIDVPPQVGEHTPISAVYNQATREYILAAVKIARIVLDEQLNPLHTDGYTHTRAVGKILYNPLFKVVITCGMDSIIINWDPVKGKRNVMIRDAHTRHQHGEKLPVEITAACFDPGNQLLLTGARNGELKVWNFNTGLCLRTMSIEHMCEVTSCFWVEGRILAIGWNKHVVEFEDEGTSSNGKSWETRHTDDVLAASVRAPLSLATASYNSELILWKLETGQPYRRFLCTEPMRRIKMQYTKKAKAATHFYHRMLLRLAPFCSATEMFARTRTDGFNAVLRKKVASLVRRVRASSNNILKKVAEDPHGPVFGHFNRAMAAVENHSGGGHWIDLSSSAAAMAGSGSAGAARHKSTIHRPSVVARGPHSCVASMMNARARRVSTVTLPAEVQHMRHVAVHAMQFLETRPSAMRVASLMVSLQNGIVQAWSDHSAGGFQGSFQGVHAAGDYVSTLATDLENMYLFTGTTLGYVKVWLMANYLRGDMEPFHVNMARLRLQFPFLWRDRIEGRAKRCVRDQPHPLLLNSYRAHLRCISSLIYIDDMKLLLTGSSDYSVRVWRLSGEYLQTLGGVVPWTLEETRFPPDVKKVASFTTFKVWRGGEVSRYTPGKVEVDKLRDITELELRTKVYGKVSDEPLLGRYFELPHRPDRQDRIQLDDTLHTIPLYTHLRMASTQPVRRLPTPPLVRDTRLKRQLATQLRKTRFSQQPTQQETKQ